MVIIYLLIGVLVASCIWNKEEEYIKKEEGIIYIIIIFIWPVIILKSIYSLMKEYIKKG